MRAIVSGASIAGLSAAYWLRHIGWDVVVLERSPRFRDGGQNVDVRGVAHEVLERMGLTEKIRAHNTTETGTVLIDERGGVIAELPSDGQDGATAELEVLRGDFARVLLDDLPHGVDIRYDTTISGVDDHGDAVSVTLASGDRIDADLLVVSEGVRSSTRDLVFGDAVKRNELGIDMVFGTIPRTTEDDDRWRWYNTVGGRQVHLRPDNHGTTRAVLAYARGEDLTKLDRDTMLEHLSARFADAGWQTPRVLDGFADSEDVYADFLMQIRMPSWHRGRACVTGDAAWCVTPLGGGGASLALTSGYVLAAYLSAHASGTGATDADGLERAFARFEAWMRPVVDSVQKLPPGIEALAYPQTRFGLGMRNLVNRALTSKPFKPLAARMSQVADTDQKLPELAAATG